MAQAPGYSVADELQRILADQRSQSRQAMLDQITSQNAEANRAHLKAQDDSLGEDRAATASWRNAQAAKVKSDQDSLDSSNKATSNFFTQQMSDPGFSTLPPTQQMAIKFGAANPGHDLTKVMLGKLLSQEKPDPNEEWYPVYNAKGEEVNSAPKGAHFLPQPNQGPQPPSMQPFESHDKEGNALRFGYDPKSNTYRKSKVEGDEPVGPMDRPGTVSNTHRVGGVSTQDVTALRTATTALAKAQENKGWGSGGATLQAAQQNLNSVRSKIASSASTNELKADVMSILSDPAVDKFPIDVIVQQLGEHRQSQGKMLTPQEVTELRGILSTILGRTK